MNLWVSILTGFISAAIWMLICALLQKDPYRRGYEDGWFDAIKQQRITETICKKLDEQNK